MADLRKFEWKLYELDDPRPMTFLFTVFLEIIIKAFIIHK